MSKPSMLWAEDGLILEREDVRMLLPWEVVERTAIEMIREHAQYDHALTSRRALGRRYDKQG